MPMIVGSAGPDELGGTDEGDVILGLAGRDSISGGGGADTIDGGEGDDYIIPGPGADLILLGDGDNMIFLRPGDSPATPDGMDTIIGWKPTDRLAPVLNSNSILRMSAPDVASALAFAASKAQEVFSGVVTVQVGRDLIVVVIDNSPAPHIASAVRLQDTPASAFGYANFNGQPQLFPDGYQVFPGAVVNGTEGVDGINGFNGGSPGNDTINGLGGNDIIDTSRGVDRIDGGDGDDRIQESTAGDTLLGGAGNDSIIAHPGIYPIGVPTLLDSDKVTTSWIDGGAGDDNIQADTSTHHQFAVVMRGGEGNDSLSTRGGVGGAIDGGAGDDVIAIQTAQNAGESPFPIVTLGPGADVLSFIPASKVGHVLVVTDFQTGDGGDRLDNTGFPLDFLFGHNRGDAPFFNNFMRFVQEGPDAVLQADYDGPSGPLPFVDFIRFLNTHATDFTAFNTYRDAPRVVTLPSQPTGGMDLVYATSGELHAGLGNDTILGLSQANYLRGDEGDDSIRGGVMFDDINGNLGADTAYGGMGDDWVVGGKDNDVLSGDAAHEYELDYRDQGNDLVYGNLGDDTLFGQAGADTVRGGQGNDSLDGGSGDDFVSGDRGDDTLQGGDGMDTFHGSQDAGVDRVLDFHLYEDLVRLDPGTTYTLRVAGADMVIDMGGGNQMILVGQAQIGDPSAWLFVG